MIHSDAQQVLDFWFGDGSLNQSTLLARWFKGGDAVDLDIHQQFKKLHASLQYGLPEDWPNDGHHLLAAIIVIDQFSRNLFRQKKEAYRWDALAQSWTLQGWKTNAFDSLTLWQQAFSIMPLVHSEDIALHNRAEKLFETLVATVDESDTIITGFYSSAKEHRAIIAEFGRYPHRNDVLGRESTQEEIDYLRAGAKRFGQ